MKTVEVTYIARTANFIPIVMVNNSGELFIVSDDHIFEDNSKFYVYEHNLITKYQPA